MDALFSTVDTLVDLLSPQRIEAVARKIRERGTHDDDQSIRNIASTPAAKEALSRLLVEWRRANVSGDYLAGILVGASYHRAQIQRDIGVELVWTGPTTPFVATRRTEQVLLDLIISAVDQLFLVSFVAHDLPHVAGALNEAALRGVEIRILLESSTNQGGSLSIDPVATIRKAVPTANLYIWKDRQEPFVGGRVHAKVAVADHRLAFITSANLTGHALEKNMEAGVLIRGGNIPIGLHSHLNALIDIGIVEVA